MLFSGLTNLFNRTSPIRVSIYFHLAFRRWPLRPDRAHAARALSRVNPASQDATTADFNWDGLGIQRRLRGLLQTDQVRPNAQPFKRRFEDSTTRSKLRGCAHTNPERPRFELHGLRALICSAPKPSPDTRHSLCEGCAPGRSWSNSVALPAVYQTRLGPP